LELYTGCSGWSYNAWNVLLYPAKLERRNWLSYYSQLFNYVEIDMTFYQIPDESIVRSWAMRTPDNFRFTAKFPKVITHDKRFTKVERELNRFYEAMLPLRDKLLALLIQFPPSFAITEGLESLKNFDFFFDLDFRYAIEVRHPSWFNDLAYNFFKDNGICMVWSQMDRVRTPPVLTSDLVYLRLIGDRSIPEEGLGILQKNRIDEMQRWAMEIKKIEKYENDVKVAIISANNHYAGFGPGTVNQFRKLLELPELPLDEVKDFAPVMNSGDYSQHNLANTSDKSIKNKQASISDFFTN
jgi:uncharacterized protein YecE (DUF72 family)